MTEDMPEFHPIRSPMTNPKLGPNKGQTVDVNAGVYRTGEHPRPAKEFRRSVGAPDQPE
jgi:hypothetical protein